MATQLETLQAAVTKAAKNLSDVTKGLTPTQRLLSEDYDTALRQFINATNELTKFQAEIAAAMEDMKKRGEELRALEETKNRAAPTAATTVIDATPNSPSNPLGFPLEPLVPRAVPPVSTISTLPSSDDGALKSSAITATSSAAPKVEVRPNALSDLASYNYIIDFYLADHAATNTMLTDEQFNPDSWYRVISSTGGLGGAEVGSNAQPASGNSKSAIAAKYFSKEYYIDNLEILTLGGIKTTECTVTFTISEPYGVSFIQQWYDFCTTELKMRNFGDVCAVIAISWKGFDDKGRLVTLPTKKYIPIIFSNIEIKLTSTGAEYSVTAVPYNHHTSLKKYGVIDRAMELTGETLGDLIDKSTKSLKAALTPTRAENTESSTTHPTVYDFLFDTVNGIDLSEILMANPEDNPIKDGEMVAAADANTLGLFKNLKNYQLLSSARQPLDRTNSVVNFNAGTSIEEIIKRLVMNSTYITNQITQFKTDAATAAAITEPAAQAAAIKELNKPLNWFKIRTKVVPTGNYDTGANTQQKKVTYIITPVQVFDTGTLGKTLVPSADPSNLVVKEYFYFFTGKNTEILNLDIKLDNNLFTYKPNNAGVARQATDDISSTANSDNGDPATTTSTPTITGSLQRTQTVELTGVGSGIGNNTAARAAAQMVAESLFSRVNLIEANMEIMGDPDLIKQDGIFYVSKIANNLDNIGFPTETLDRYIRLQFKSPRDINTETGITDFKDSTDTVFNGIYRFNQVTSEFKQGKFTQNVKMIRCLSDDIKVGGITAKVDNPLSKPATPAAPASKPRG